MSRPLLALAALVVYAAPLRADTLPLIQDQPTEYIPGVPLMFELHAPGLVDFTRFHIDLVFQTENDPANLTVSADRPDALSYPFGATGNFSAFPSFPPEGNPVTLSIDGSGTLAITTAGVNDLLAIVTLTPGEDLTGAILVSIDPGTLRFDRNGEITPTIDPPAPFFIQQGEPKAAPAPAAWVLLGIGGVALLRRSRTVGEKKPHDQADQTRFGQEV
jgi:MYXO-CTERM domain-containing protein